MKTIACRAENPANCRIHGNPAALFFSKVTKEVTNKQPSANTGVIVAAQQFNSVTVEHKTLTSKINKAGRELEKLKTLENDLPAALLHYGLEGKAYDVLLLERIIPKTIQQKVEEKTLLQAQLVESRRQIVKARKQLEKATGVITEAENKESSLSELPVFLQKNPTILKFIHEYNVGVKKITTSYTVPRKVQLEAVAEQRTKLERVLFAHFRNKMFTLKRKEYELGRKATEMFMDKLNKSEPRRIISFN